MARRANPLVLELIVVVALKVLAHSVPGFGRMFCNELRSTLESNSRLSDDDREELVRVRRAVEPPVHQVEH